MSKVVFISPHLDDVVLSCGELLAKLRLAKQDVLVITIFSGHPMPDHLSQTAKEFHASCKLGNNAIQVRKGEDIAAMNLLEVAYRHMDELECLYRINPDSTFKYNGIGEIFTSDLSRDRDTIDYLSRKIETVFAETNPHTVFMPLGIGNHIDHVISRKSIENIADRYLFKTYYYQDTPYVCNIDSYIDEGALSSMLVPVTEKEWQMKCSAVKCYASQMRMLWKDEAAMQLQLDALSYKHLMGSRSIRIYSSGKADFVF